MGGGGAAAREGHFEAGQGYVWEREVLRATVLTNSPDCVDV